METKHTPGPWNLGKISKHGYKQFIDGVGWKRLAAVIVALDDQTVYPAEFKPSIEGKANAKLIAAAPDLLNACIKALEYHQGGHSEIGHILRGAIEKATI